MRTTIRTAVLIALFLVAVLGVETGRVDEGVTTTVGNRFSQTSTPLTNEQVWMGNSQASTVDQDVGGDYGGGVADRNMKIGFNLIRAWDLSPAK